MASGENFDLIVIGCGPAGEKAGAQAAYFGKRVAVIERAEHMGEAASTRERSPAKLSVNPRSIFPDSSSAGFMASITRSKKI